MWNEPTTKQLAMIPKPYSTEEIPLKDKKIYMKFFIGGWTWYVAEFDGRDSFFGYVKSPLMEGGEWGYFSLAELKSLKSGIAEVDRELHGITVYKPKKFGNLRSYD